MRATYLRQFLQSLCFKSPWNYAVFWKLQHQHPMVLTWEDGYLDIPCASEPSRSLIGNDYSKSLNELLSPNCGSRSHNGYLGDNPIGLAMAEMSSTHHVAGKGVVGEVASLGIPRWIFADSVAPAEFSYGSVAECPDEWLLQFVAGIKTILLVPCIPYGVLQLGSKKTVAENVEMVAYLAGEFDAHFKFLENFSPGGESCEYLLQSTLSESLDTPSITTITKVNQDVVAADNPILENHKLSTAFPMTSLFEVQDFQLFEQHMPSALRNANESNMPKRHADRIDLMKQLNHQYSDNRSEITENSFNRSSCNAKDVDTFSYNNCNVDGVDLFNEVDFYLDGDLLNQQTVGKDCSDIRLRNLSNSFSCPTDCELYKALGGTIHNNLCGFSENAASKSIYAEDCMSNIDPSFEESNGWCLEEDNAENLLESVVAGACISDYYSIDKMMSLKSLNMPSGEPVPLRKRKNQLTKGDLVGDNTVTGSTLTSASAGPDKYALEDSSHSASSFDCIISTFNEGKHQKKIYSSLRPKESKISNSNKKRGRSGDCHRPRPRDRQLIQDRLKELRQLVPNGAKCSIDGLLDKTIKHMLFLRTVTNQADKLRRQAQKEVAPDKSTQSPGVKTSCQQGTSWAVELGSEDQICPIMVKDLELPGHMLIEMMCDDHARYLEIADVIHRLELTILKGVMEKRSENTWAHFIVEASGGCHRLDIFWPLMQLIQQVPSSISGKM